MKLYYVPQAPVGQRWQGTQVDAKSAAKAVAGDFIQREVPVDKPNLIGFLNAEESVITQQEPAPNRKLDPLEQAELRAVAAAQGEATTMPNALRYDYDSPFSARSALAGIDAGMCARAIEQLHGSDLGKVVAACIKRISQLAHVAIVGGGQTDG